jgi:DNA invertase Pin-like site-specific DNA recombinase
VSGTDPIETRPGFSALLDRIEGNGVRTVLVEDASRFARQLIVQEAVLTASGDDLTASEDPFKVAMRQIAGVFAQLEKARLVAKLKAARDRKRETGAKVEGRKSLAEIDLRDNGGRMVELAKKLRRKKPKGGRYSLRTVAVELEKAGFVSHTGKPLRRNRCCSDVGGAMTGMPSNVDSLPSLHRIDCLECL